MRLPTQGVQPADVEQLHLEFPVRRLKTVGGAFNATYDERFGVCLFGTTVNVFNRPASHGSQIFAPGAACTRKHSLAGARFALVAAPADHSGDGTNNYEYRALDNAGNVSATGSCAVRIDTTNPTVGDDAPAGWSNHAVTVTLNPVDPGAPCTRNFGEIENTPRSIATFWPRSDSRYPMNASAALGCFAPASTAIGSGVTHAVDGATNLMSKPASRSSNAM